MAVKRVSSPRLRPIRTGLLELMATCLRHVAKVVTRLAVGFHVACATYCVPIGRSHGELSRSCTAAQFRRTEVGRDDVR